MASRARRPTLATLERVAEAYWGAGGVFAYAALRWANAALFSGELPPILLQWALTPYGHCVGSTACLPGAPVVTLHPTIWRPGRGSTHAVRRPTTRGQLLYTTDVVVHELTHAHLAIRGEATEHNARPWCREVMRLSPLIGLPGVVASPDKRARERDAEGRATGRLLRVPKVPGSISREALASWPHSLRPATYYARHPALPFPCPPEAQRRGPPPARDVAVTP